MVTLERIRQQGSPDLYPARVLEGCESALILFAAGFYGKQDAVWIADAGLLATCVDVDAVKLDEMMLAYPAGWEFVNGDVFEYAAVMAHEVDVVSLDPPTNLFERCAEMLPLWCLLARRAVVLGSGETTVIVPPAGWELTERRYRSSFQGGVYWSVLEPR